MGKFARAPCAKLSPVCMDPFTRNAFMQFLGNYRRKQPCNCPAWMVAARAGNLWSTMPQSEKCQYIAAARRAGYVYKSRERRVNRVMRRLRKAVNCDDRFELGELKHAVKQMQLWKRRILREMCSDV